MPLTRGIGWSAPFYDLLAAPLEQRVFRHWRALAWSRLPAGGAGRGIEIGVGTGANFPCYPEAAEVVATDLSPAMLRRAAARRPAGVPLVACDALALPFASSTFHWGIATLVFCEVPDPVAGLAELRRVVRPDGRVVLLEHVRPSGWRGRVADGLTAVAAPLWGEHFDRDAEAAALAAGFSVERSEWLWRDGVVLLELSPRAAPGGDR